MTIKAIPCEVARIVDSPRVRDVRDGLKNEFSMAFFLAGSKREILPLVRMETAD